MKPGLNQINTSTMNVQPGETIPLLATTAGVSVPFALVASAKNYDCIVTNAGSNTAFIAFGNGSATAQLPGTGGTLNATPILPGETMTLQKNSDAVAADTCAGITSTGTTQLYFTSCQGS